MESKKSHRRMSTTTGSELIHIHGFASTKKQMYSFSNSSDEFLYIVGSNVIVYDPVKNVQKDYLKNTKALPFSSIEFSIDGNDLFVGEHL